MSPSKIEEGEVLGLAGESGSGKTTLGSIISLIARPPLHVEHGTLEIDGKVQELGEYAKIPRTWRGAVVSMLPQGAMNSISPTKRVRQLVYDVMRSHDRKICKDEALDRARDRITTLGLPARVLDAYPHQLSGGMKQRTVTIISTLLNPRLLVADEPTSALDVTSQKILIEMLLEMLKERIMSGVIFVTHDLPVLRTVATQIAVMYQGRIVETGTDRHRGQASGAPLYPGADELGAGAGAGVRQDQDRGHERLQPRRLRRPGGDPRMTVSDGRAPRSAVTGSTRSRSFVTILDDGRSGSARSARGTCRPESLLTPERRRP